jgi:hypothetical protein
MYVCMYTTTALDLNDRKVHCRVKLQSMSAVA